MAATMNALDSVERETACLHGREAPAFLLR